jgi:hypothetical protein
MVDSIEEKRHKGLDSIEEESQTGLASVGRERYRVLILLYSSLLQTVYEKPLSRENLQGVRESSPDRA